MCGRARRTIPVAALAQLVDIDAAKIDPTDNPVRHNISPTQDLLVVRHSVSQGERVAEAIRWGLVPFWSKTPKSRPIINARSETARSKPAFRAAFKRRRCLIPLSGYYEWKRGADKSKLPYHYTTKQAQETGRGFCVAGLWERWKPKGDGADTDVLTTCAILTVPANALAWAVHDRMPAIIDPADFDLWLDPEADLDAVEGLLAPYDADAMLAWRVSTEVNSSRNEGPHLAEPIVGDVP